MKAVVYDKWLHSLGGGEVVACNIAKILLEKGYKVLFISGKEVSLSVISDKLKINLAGIEFKQVWNDETAIKKYSKDCDLFINTSFMDYTIGFARKNIYYTHFPDKSFDSLKGLILTRFILPVAKYFIKPIESINLVDAQIIMKNKPAYQLDEKNKYALTNVDIGKIQVVDFELFIENFSQNILENIEISLENGSILNKLSWIKHHHNTVSFRITFLPKSNTVYLNLNIAQENYEDYEFDEGKIYLFYPKFQLRRLSNFLFSDIVNKLAVRFRAGIFVNVQERLNTYQSILANSYYTQRWIEKYWDRQATVISPPVDLFYKKNNLNKLRKKNWICSIGRFFTLGHGKKQEVLIEAFKLLCKRNKQKWELHLVGGLGEEPSSIEFFKYLRRISKGYPIFFHINVSRQEVINIYQQTKIYWHATGYGEKENQQPIRFEHFGIAPIEAISARCIPILFRGGGLKEIIAALKLNKQRNLFSNIEELVNNTIYYQNKQNQQLDWKLIFFQLNELYSLETFKTKFFKLLSSLK